MLFFVCFIVIDCCGIVVKLLQDSWENAVGLLGDCCVIAVELLWDSCGMAVGTVVVWVCVCCFCRGIIVVLLWPCRGIVVGLP